MPLGAKLSISKYPAFSRFRHLPDSLNSVQQSLTIIETRPYQGVGQCFEAPGVPPVLESGTAYRSRQNWRARQEKFPCQLSQGACCSRGGSPLSSLGADNPCFAVCCKQESLDPLKSSVFRRLTTG